MHSMAMMTAKAMLMGKAFLSRRHSREGAEAGAGSATAALGLQHRNQPHEHTYTLMINLDGNKSLQPAV